MDAVLALMLYWLVSRSGKRQLSLPHHQQVSFASIIKSQESERNNSRCVSNSNFLWARKAKIATWQGGRVFDPAFTKSHAKFISKKIV